MCHAVSGEEVNRRRIEDGHAEKIQAGMKTLQDNAFSTLVYP
jgi:hypothetical protein